MNVKYLTTPADRRRRRRRRRLVVIIRESICESFYTRRTFVMSWFMRNDYRWNLLAAVIHFQIRESVDEFKTFSYTAHTTTTTTVRSELY